MLRSVMLIVATAALAWATTAPAQAQSDAQLPPAVPSVTSPAPPSGAPSYDEQQLRAFANATVDLQAMGAQGDAAMARAIEASGLSVEQYNQMGDVMRASPEQAARLTPYLQSAQIDRVARASATANLRPYGLGSPTPQRVTAHARKGSRSYHRSRSARRAHASGKASGAHHRSGRHGASGSSRTHHAVPAKARHAPKSKARHARRG